MRTTLIIGWVIWVTGIALPLRANPLHDLYPTKLEGEVGLYRILNLVPSKVTVKVGQSQPDRTVDALTLSPYYTLAAGRYRIEADRNALDFSLAPERAKTFVYQPSGWHELTSHAELLVSKALVNFINLSPHPLSLQTHAGEVLVLGPIPFGEVAARQVNELNIKLAVFDEATKVADFQAVFLQRGHSYTFWVVLTQNGWVAEVSEDRIVH